MFVEANGGKDSNSGSAKAPVATVQRANAIISKARQENPELKGAEVVIGGGEYYLSGTIEATGSTYDNVTYRAKAGQTPEIIGGKAFLVSEATKVTDTSILNRVIDSNARNNLYQYDLGALLGGKEKIQKIALPGAYSFQFGVNNLINGAQGETTHELFYDDGSTDTVMSLSRYPNEGHANPNDDYMRIGTVNNEGTVYKDYTSGTVTPFSITPADKSRVSKWATADQAAMFGYWKWDWATQAVMVGSINGSTGMITAKYPSVYGVDANQKFYIYNLLEEIDMVNEYFIDRNTGILYFYKSPNAKSTDKITISTLTVNSLMQVKNADNVKIKGLAFKAGIYSGVRLVDCTNSAIENCDISNMARTAVVLSGGSNNKIEGCYIHDVDSGIALNSGTDEQTDIAEETLTKTNNVAINNEIERFARITKAYRPAIQISGVGNVATHNEIHDSEHNAIMFSGNEHEISYNDIYDVCQATSDAGAIYAGRSWVDRGTEIKYNYIHDITSSFTEYDSYVSAIFLDDTYAGTTMYGNIIADMADLGIQINGGRDNTIEKNIIVNCATEPTLWLGMPATWVNHYSSLEKAPYTSAAWVKEYPELKAAVTNGTIELPENNKYINNVFYNNGNTLTTAGKAFAASISNYLTNSGNITASSSSIFKDYANKNYQLVDGCEVYTQISNFPKIDFASIGRTK